MTGGVAGGVAGGGTEDGQVLVIMQPIIDAQLPFKMHLRFGIHVPAKKHLRFGVQVPLIKQINLFMHGVLFTVQKPVILHEKTFIVHTAVTMQEIILD
ncbi:MAG TPA: hypothetical protein VN207_11410 [Ktedonobacteraceae bacterium]|nr:hypothetical protein [Ktedonobacteraceae bacterium]